MRGTILVYLLASGCTNCPEDDLRLPPQRPMTMGFSGWSADEENPTMQLRGDVGQLTYHDSQNGDVVIRFRIEPNW